MVSLASTIVVTAECNGYPRRADPLLRNNADTNATIAIGSPTLVEHERGNDRPEFKRIIAPSPFPLMAFTFAIV